MKDLTRRDFLKGAAIGAAGAATMSLATACVSDNSNNDNRNANSTHYAVGAYTAQSQGKFFPLTVEVVFDAQSIVGVTVTKHEETTAIADSALKYIPQTIVDGQTLNVDTIAGATITSFAILNAVEDCVKQAGGDTEALRQAPKAPSSKAMTAGVYTVEKHGHHSDVVVEVTLGSSSIDAVKIVSSGETFNLSDAATGAIPQRIVESQSAGVDTVAGATYTSRAIMSAVEDCIEKAGGIAAVRAFDVRTASEPWSTEEKSLETDVVVVGSGMAGIAAALSAQDNGARVIIVEKLPFWGGISQTCAGGFAYAGGDDPELVNAYYEYGIHTPVGIMKGETVDAEYPDKALMRTFAEQGTAAVRWLESKGMAYYDIVRDDLVTAYPYILHTALMQDPDGKQAPDLAGANFKVYLDTFFEKGGEIILECEVQSLITASDGSVVGINATGKGGKYTISSKAVVLAAGGFGADAEMIKQYAPAYENEYNVTAVTNTGDGIRMGLELGAAVYDSALMMGQYGHSIMTDYEMVHPYSDSIQPVSCLFVNSMGLRANSEAPDMYTNGSTYLSPDPNYRDYYWAISNAGNAAQGDYKKILDEQIAAGAEGFYTAETMSELARMIKMTPNTLRYTINRYNRFCESGNDTDFHKPPEYLLPFNDEGPWYAARCRMAYFGTVGGLKINSDAAVLTADGEPIRGLFAAGENANHGVFNLCYMGGRSMSQCLVFGRIAGASAAGS
jgi:fumarate reductase flavoprotein subunit